MAVSAATVLGEFAGLLYIMYRFRQYRPRVTTATLSNRQITRYLFTVGTPVTMQRLVMSLVLMLQSFLIPNLLHAGGLTTETATALYGNFSGVAMSLVNLPGIFTATLSMAILPAVAETNHRQDLLNSRVNQSLQLTVLVGIPVSVIFSLYGTELCDWLFNTPAAGEILKILALGSVFIYAHTILTGILQGMGNVKYLLFNLILSGLVLQGLLYLLVPQFGIIGAAVSSIIFFSVNCLLNLKYLFINCCLKFDFSNILLKPVFAIVAALIVKKTANGIFAVFYATVNQYIDFLLNVSIIIAVYLLILCLTGGMPKLIVKYFRR